MPEFVSCTTCDCNIVIGFFDSEPCRQTIGFPQRNLIPDEFCGVIVVWFEGVREFVVTDEKGKRFLAYPCFVEDDVDLS